MTKLTKNKPLDTLIRGVLNAGLLCSVIISSCLVKHVLLVQAW